MMKKVIDTIKYIYIMMAKGYTEEQILALMEA